eukprot:517720-Pyramimonas_sp.AAC.1
MVATLARIRFRAEAPPWKIPHSQEVGRFYGEWSKLVPNVFVKGTSGAGETPACMWAPPVGGRRMQFAEFKASENGGSGQWEILMDAWPEFAQRHETQHAPEQIEAAVASRRI